MRLFQCQHCNQVLYFENVRCERCSYRLGYLSDSTTLSALEPAGKMWQPLAAPDQPMRFCDNAQYDACNWLVPAGSNERYCVACRYNRTVPDLTDPASLARWQKMELAKHRLFYSLLRLGLPLRSRDEDTEQGLVFDLLADSPAEDGPKVLTGHDNGVITVALIEADDAERERRRVAMGEPYRTLLGHFRHEVGHYFWDRLVDEGGHLAECRAVFGDDRLDYGQALQHHYEQGAPPDWQDNFVSAYASTHAWEDWAETWAHYLHIVDTLEMANAFGMHIRPKLVAGDALEAEVDFDAYHASSIEQLIGAWLPLTFAANSLNRCMGAADLYPFVLPPAVVHKLGFIHQMVQSAGRERTARG